MTNVFYTRQEDAIKGIGAVVDAVIKGIQNDTCLRERQKKNLINQLRAELKIKTLCAEGTAEYYIEKLEREGE